MHPRSPYAEYTDFAKLAKDCPSLAKYLNANNSINFKDPDAVRELTTCLLKRDFGLTVQLPPDRLCPTVPNRLNYVLWMQDLVDSTSGGHTDAYDPTRKVIGLDIGTGASCIYPLLACATRPSWHMHATDIDAASLSSAHTNAALNAALTPRITLHAHTPTSPLIPATVTSLDFTMCNPPFYASTASSAASASFKRRPPHARCTGTQTEMVHADGGEAAFVARILAESVHRARSDPNTWYSSMLGKLESVAPLLDEVKRHTRNYAVAEFRQGVTRRWGVAWCFGGWRPRVKGGEGGAVGGPFPTLFRVGEEAVVGRVMGVVEGLGAAVGWVPGGEVEKREGVMGWGETAGNVWSRAARRRLARAGGGERMETDTGGEPDREEVKMGFRIEVVGGEVLVRWTRGTDQVLFESFCGMLRRGVKER